MKSKENNKLMTTPNNKNGKNILEQIARRVMLEHGFLPDFSPAALDELAKIQQVNGGTAPAIKDLRQMLWASIDNDDSLNLDQLTAAEMLPDNSVKIFVAIADVDALVKKTLRLTNMPIRIPLQYTLPVRLSRCFRKSSLPT